MAKVRRQLSTGAIVGIVVGSSVGLMALLLVAYVAAYTIRPSHQRFTSDVTAAGCTVSGSTLTVRYGIKSAEYPSAADENVTVRPDTSTGLTYLWLAVDPALEVDDNHEVSGGPAGQNVRLDSGTTLVMMFSEQSRTARIEGLRVDWSYGETGGYQVLPLTVRATATGCTASVETDH